MLTSQPAVIAAAAAASLVTAWLMVAAVLPSLRLRDAAAVNLGSSAVANTMPGGAVRAGLVRPGSRAWPGSGVRSARRA